MYYASLELSTTNISFMLYQETTVNWMLKIPPIVLFWSDGLPIQSALVKPWSFTPSIFLYHNTYWEVALSYLNTFFAAFQYSLVGLTISLLGFLTT